MKKMRTVLLLIMTVCSGILVHAGNTDGKMTAESMFEMASTLDESDYGEYKAMFEELSAREKGKLVNMALEDVRLNREMASMDASIGLVILAIILPPLAVGIYTNWGTPTLWNLLFTLLGWVPGIIHAFYIIL